MAVVCLVLISVFGLVRADLGLPRFPQTKVEDTPVLEISQDDITKAFAYAKEQYQNRIESENKYIEADPGNTVPETELSMDVRIIGLVLPKTAELAKNQEQFEDASRWLSKKYSLPQEQILLGLRSYSLPDDIPVVQQCKSLKEVSPCDENYKYRTIDGSCNNLANPSWGQTASCYNRMMKQDFSDGLSVPRLAVSGGELPNGRFVSRSVVDNVNIPSKLTQMGMFFAQFVCHDFTLAVSTLGGSNGSYMTCCQKMEPTVEKPAVCYPISISPDDPDFPNRTCLGLMRSAACSEDCKLGSPRRHVNQQTAYLDASAVYGTDLNQSLSLRSLKGGALLNQYSDTDELPPPSFHPDEDQCSKSMNNNHTCITAGDYRAVEQPGMTAHHIIWFREHNRIAKILSKDYPQLSDEEIFQEARRILAAELQVVTYKEMLPALIGPDMMKFFQLSVLPDGYSTYDPKTDPRVMSEFSVGAGRFGHSMVQRWYKQFGKDGKEEEQLDMNENSFTMPCFYEGKMDSITRGMYHQNSQTFDRHFTDPMFKGTVTSPGKKDGLDHVAFNIQRGRDVGLPSYVDAVKFCYNVTISSFDDLTLIMTPESIQKLRNAYSDVRDIDFYIGGFSETPNSDAVMGPTFACFLGLQYHNLKFGDRYFVEHGNQVGSFTQGQLKELRSRTLASIVCQNTGAGIITPNVFHIIDANNPLTDCSSIPSPDFTKWLDK